MDRNERINDTVNALQKSQKGWQQKIWTALPGIVESFDSEKLTAVVQPSIQAQLLDPDSGDWSNKTLPLCLDCPVKFLWGAIGGFTVPLRKGDEGLLVFASRCIDSWWQSGGVQTQAEFRMHDLSDGFFLPGVFSQPKIIPSFNNDFPEMRNADGTIKFTQTATGFRVTGTLEITGDINISGSFKALDGSLYSGSISTSGGVEAGVGGADHVTLQHHQHPGNNTPPTPGH
jgi:hypothetical protein